MELFAFSEVQTRLSIEHVRSDDVCCLTLKKLRKKTWSLKLYKAVDLPKICKKRRKRNRDI